MVQGQVAWPGSLAISAEMLIAEPKLMFSFGMVSQEVRMWETSKWYCLNWLFVEATW